MGVCNVQDADAFGSDEMTDREIDALYEAEMARRDAEAAEVFGDDDTDPTRPGGAAMPRPLAADDFAAEFARYTDDNLVVAVDCLDRGTVENVTEGQRLLMLDAAMAEVLRRLDRPRRHAA